MAGATKNAKKIYMSRTNRPIFGNKRSLFIVLLLLFIASLAALVSGYQRHIIEIDKNNVIKMRSEVDVLAKKIKIFNPEISWRNDSSCSIFRPNTLGESISYSCNVLYTHRQSIASQQDVDGLIHAVTKTLNVSDDIVRDVKDYSTGSVEITNATSQNSYYNATSFALKEVQLDQGMCYVRYIISDTNNIEVILECAVGTKEPYFEPIKEL